MNLSESYKNRLKNLAGLNESQHHVTDFQQRLINDGETIVKIVQTLYPDLKINWAEERGSLKVSAHPHYTWVLIKYKDGHCVDFAIDNHEGYINGQSVTGQITSDTYKMANFPFKIIPFKTRSRCNKDISEPRKKIATKILADAGYTKPSFEEWWREYYTD